MPNLFLTKKCGVDYTIKYHQLVFERDRSKLSHSAQIQIEKAIREKILLSPERFGRPLRKTLKGNRRLRVGDYRIIYRVAEDIIFVWAIGHRSTIYKAALNRILVGTFTVQDDGFRRT